jgi:N-hydroxyarylamine O-acetyltransferase
MAAVDINAYFRRIGYDGERRPTLATLRQIQFRHTATIAFENLNPLLSWPVPLDPQALEHKIVRCGRGGYCFEQNLLLRHVLEALGFTVIGLAARVLWNVPEGTISPRSHMLLRVEIDGSSYVVDAGFGLTPTAPLRLQPEIVQATPHEDYRLLETAKGFLLQARLGGHWNSLYVFDLQEQEQRDYEVANWYVSTHPESHFIRSLIVARAAPGRRYALRNNEFTARDASGKADKQLLADAGALRRTLQEVFGLNLPDARELDTALQRIAALDAAPTPALGGEETRGGEDDRRATR